MDNPRKLALASLIKAELSSTYSNIEVNTVISRSRLSKADCALYTALYLGVTERLITLDYLISKYSKIKIADLETETRNALRMGFYQLMYMDKIPDYSAVSETVAICPRRSKGFVNACLRGFIRDDKELTLPQDEWKALSIKASIPVAIIDIFRASYGDTTAKELTLSLSSARAGVVVRINTLKIEPRELRRILKGREIRYTHIGFAEELLRINAPVSTFIDLIDKGLCFVQDTASFACTRIFGAESGETVLDACACPGGKSFSCAIDMKNEGEIYSCDLHKSKLSLVESGASRLGVSIIRAIEQDAQLPREEFVGRFDRVLCDVPCSGLGIIAKKPDIRHKSVEQMRALPDIQLGILNNCSKYVKQDGVLVYSTCTLNRAENEDIIARFLADNDSFAPLDFELGDLKSKDAMLTFMPHILETDGFFVAKMKRIK